MRTLRGPSALLGAAGAGILVSMALGVPLARGEARPATIPVEQVKEGMKGYGLTVFHGTQPERFDVEVIGVLHHFRPGQPLIIVKTPNPRLDVVHTVKGMSGSPIFLDGRLAGAYSYSMSAFELEPVAGVTPIDLMLTEMRRPIPPGFWPLERTAPLPGGKEGPRAPHPPHASLDGFEGPPGTYDFAEHARQLAARIGPVSDPGATIRPAATPLMLGGMGDHTVAALRQLLEPLGLDPMQGGGGGGAPDPNAPTHFVNGGALGVELIRGDVAATGLGTATFADGAGKVAGFGHPMLGGGDEALPACIGRILWFEASAQSSHKIGECVRSLGTLVQDRQTAIIIDEGFTAPTIPIDVELTGVTGAPKTHWHAEVTDDKFMAPGLVAAVFSSAIEATASERRDFTWKLTSKVDVAGHGLVDLEDVGVSQGGSPDTSEMFRQRVVATVGDVLGNPWEHARIRSVEARFDVKFARELYRLRGAELLDPVVDAGAKARVRLHLVPEQGPEITRTLDVTMPEELEGKDVEVDVVPGYDVVPELAAPESLDELLANEPRQSVAPRSVVLQFRVPSQGMAYKGHVTQRLPAFTLDALRPQSGDTGPETFNSWERTVVPLDWFIEGKDKVKVKVRPVMR